MRNRLFLFLIMILPLLAGCGDEKKVIDGLLPGPFATESEPSLSLNKQYVYYVSTDTTMPELTGLYRASVETPVREKVLLGADYHSPVISGDNATLAYLVNGRINYYRIADSVKSQSSITDSFNSIIYVDNSLLVANRDTALYLVNEAQHFSVYFARGWDPSPAGRDTIVYFTGYQPNYTIVMQVINNPYATVPVQVTTSAYPHWPTFDAASNRVCYELEWVDQKYIYSRVVGDSARFIDSAFTSKPYLVNFNLIIFTGRDGRFWQSDFFGDHSVPWVFVKHLDFAPPFSPYIYVAADPSRLANRDESVLGNKFDHFCPRWFSFVFLFL